jgi:hypothetical protein
VISNSSDFHAYAMSSSISRELVPSKFWVQDSKRKTVSKRESERDRQRETDRQTDREREREREGGRDIVMYVRE